MDSTGFHFLVERLKEISNEIRSTDENLGNKLDDLRLEVQATYARESDCLGRHERESQARVDGFKRLWQAIEETAGQLKSSREKTLVEDGKKEITGRAWTWTWGIVAAVLTALLISLLTGRM